MTVRATVAPLPKPGYVYAMGNATLPGLLKIGHTHRPPHRRARELSRTAVPTPFEVEHARFFWSAPAAERRLHAQFSAQRISRRREFFGLNVEALASAIDGLTEVGVPATSSSEGPYGDEPWAWRVADPDWDRTLEGLEEQWAWGEEDARSADPAVRRQAWVRWEGLSASGWGEGSWRLAERLWASDPSLRGAQRAVWVLDAAHAQGVEGASFKAAWLRSFLDPERFRSPWERAVRHAAERWGAADERTGSWPAWALELWRSEQAQWPAHPTRRIDPDPTISG